MSRAERRALVERENLVLPVSQQCRLLAVSRSSIYRQPPAVSEEEHTIMVLIDRQYLARPYYGSRRILQRAGEVVTGELAALVSIENLGSTIPGERFLERLDTRLSTERVRQPPRQYGAAHPVHDDDEVEEALGHRDIGNVRAPDLVDPLDRDAPEQIRVDFVRRSCLAR